MDKNRHKIKAVKSTKNKRCIESMPYHKPLSLPPTVTQVLSFLTNELHEGTNLLLGEY